MPTLLRTGLVLSCLPLSAYLRAQDEKRQYPAYDYDLARTHEIKPHRRTIPTIGIGPGFNQLRLTLIVSPAGDVVDAQAGGEPETLKHWPPLVGEVRSWKFIPFEDQGKAVTAEVEEYIDLVPPERLPKKHVAAPTLKPNSQVTITLQRTGCFGSCPAYTVTASTDGITFEGRRFVVASGTHTDRADSRDIRNLAKRFVTADFYSMDSSYRASVTDNPTYVLSIAIDGRKKEVEDYVGAWEGMPAVISELEKEVDQLTRTARWIEGTGGLVPALQAEEFKFQTFEAQVMLKEAASRGRTETVRDFCKPACRLSPCLRPSWRNPA